MRADRQIVVRIAAVVEVESAEHVLVEQPRDDLLDVLGLIMMAGVDQHLGLRSGRLRQQQGHAPVGDIGMIERRLERLVFDEHRHPRRRLAAGGRCDRSLGRDRDAPSAARAGRAGPARRRETADRLHPRAGAAVRGRERRAAGAPAALSGTRAGGGGTPILMVAVAHQPYYVLDLLPELSVIGSLRARLRRLGARLEGAGRSRPDACVHRLLDGASRRRARRPGSPVALLGYCMGGTLATMFAARHPAAVKRCACSARRSIPRARGAAPDRPDAVRRRPDRSTCSATCRRC